MPFNSKFKKNQLEEKDCLVEEEKVSKKLGRNIKDKLTDFEAEVSDFPSQRLSSEAWGIKGQQLQQSADNRRPSKFHWIQAEIAQNDARLKNCRGRYVTLVSQWNAFVDSREYVAEKFLQIGTSLTDINEELERVSCILEGLRDDQELTNFDEQLSCKTPDEFKEFDKHVIGAAMRNCQVTSATLMRIEVLLERAETGLKGIIKSDTRIQKFSQKKTRPMEVNAQDDQIRRRREVFEYAIKHHRPFVFIDEVHQFTNYAELCKTYFDKGELRVIGPTKLCEFKPMIIKDPALKRRFSRILPD